MIKIEATVNIDCVGKNKLFLHQQIGEGKIGKRKLRFVMSNNGVVMQVYDEADQEYDCYSIPWDVLSKSMVDAIFEHEKNDDVAEATDVGKESKAT